MEEVFYTIEELKEMLKSDNPPYGFIYITENLINGKKYIGQKNFKRDWKTYLGSGTLLKRAEKKYGRVNFNRVVISVCSSKEEMDSKEIYYINKYNAHNDNSYYNIARGGSVNNPWEYATDEQKLERGKNKSKQMQGSGNPFYGKTHTDETKQILSKMKTGENNPYYKIPRTEVVKQKIIDGIASSKKKKMKSVVCLNNMKAYPSSRAAGKDIGTSNGNIICCCQNKQSCAGFIDESPAIWMYYEDYIKLNEKEIQDVYTNKLSIANKRRAIK